MEMFQAIGYNRIEQAKKCCPSPQEQLENTVFICYIIQIAMQPINSSEYRWIDAERSLLVGWTHWSNTMLTTLGDKNFEKYLAFGINYQAEFCLRDVKRENKGGRFRLIKRKETIYEELIKC